jgi:TIR domain
MPERQNQNDRIFLCHSSLDKPFVRKLARNLRDRGVSTWFDELELRVGDSLREKIEAAIQSSGRLAVVLSQNSVESEWVKRELNAAFVRELELKRVFILPLRIDNCDVPLFLRDKVYADFRKSHDDGLAALLIALGIQERNLARGMWWGRWNILPQTYRSGQLLIHRISDKGFRFTVRVNSGAHDGYLEGLAEFITPTQATFRKTAPDADCELRFFIDSSDPPEVHVDEVSFCQGFHGAQTNFGDKYVKEPEPLYERQALDEVGLDHLFELMGKRYWSFRDLFYIMTTVDNLDQFSALGFRGWAPGLADFVDAILLAGKAGQLWAAWLDEDVIRYFTSENHFRRTLPKTIEVWRERFRGKAIVWP